MNILILAVALFIVATTANAAWSKLDDGDTFIVYVDNATIQRSGNIATMADLSDYKKERTSATGVVYLSQKARQEFNCKEGLRRRLSFTWHSEKMGNGKVVYTSDKTEEWSPIPRGSLGQALWQAACRK